jgi:hypothetical protein
MDADASAKGPWETSVLPTMTVLWRLQSPELGGPGG